jgi:lipoprotein-anchoring transpeptidase ErfK/SrfK
MTLRQGGVFAGLIATVALAGGCSAARVSLPPGQASHHDHVVTVENSATAGPTGPAATASATAAAGFNVNVTTVVATTHGAVPGSAAPGAPQNTLVPATWYGYPSILPVIGTAPGWVEIRLAQRPNGSTTWVPMSDVGLSVTPYQLVLDLSTEHLMVYEYGNEILDFPAGVGAPDDPTVTGDYFITMRVPPPDPGYGAFVLVTSAHSDSISDWDNSGDAIIAIHGPITSYDDALIGTTGAAISHGCVRLHDADLAQLGMIPAGTPLDIIP